MITEHTDFHTEKILCPNCNSIENGIVYHTAPFYSYVHNCSQCEYIIMESEWELIESKEYITVWEYLNPKKIKWQFNHIEYGIVNKNQAKPKPKSEEQKRSWKNKKWRKSHALLINSKVVYPNNKPIWN